MCESPAQGHYIHVGTEFEPGTIGLPIRCSTTGPRKPHRRLTPSLIWFSVYCSPATRVNKPTHYHRVSVWSYFKTCKRCMLDSQLNHCSFSSEVSSRLLILITVFFISAFGCKVVKCLDILPHCLHISVKQYIYGLIHSAKYALSSFLLLLISPISNANRLTFTILFIFSHGIGYYVAEFSASASMIDYQNKLLL